MNTQLLIDTARAMVADDKGLLAMDESHPTCNKRFAKLNIPQTEEARRVYRELIITTPGLHESISGAILFDETIRQHKKDGTPFIQVITDAGLVSRNRGRFPALGAGRGCDKGPIPLLYRYGSHRNVWSPLGLCC